MKLLTYTRDDIVRRTAEKVNMNRYEMKVCVDSVLETLTEMLMENRKNYRIELRNFGVFEVKPTKAKPRARNPRTNVEVYVPPRRKIHFKAGKVIRTVLQKEWID